MADWLSDKPFYRFGECGSQLRPRFFHLTDESSASISPEFVYQGLDLPLPPSGRRVRSIFEDCGDINPQVCNIIFMLFPLSADFDFHLFNRTLAGCVNRKLLFIGL